MVSVYLQKKKKSTLKLVLTNVLFSALTVYMEMDWAVVLSPTAFQIRDPKPGDCFYIQRHFDFTVCLETENSIFGCVGGTAGEQ